LIWRRRPGLILLVAGVCLSYGFSIPVTATLLGRTLEIYPPLPERQLASLSGKHSAIVVLAGGLHTDAPEYGGQTLHLRTLGRLRYGARLARRGDLPVLVSGGVANPNNPHPGAPREAHLMGRALRLEFGIQRVWLEADSRNTWDNAVYSAELLRQRGIRQVVLVTQAAHMRRAVEAFQAQGLAVWPAPTLYSFRRLELATPDAWLPSASAVAGIYYACHEWLGLWYYRLLLHPDPEAPQDGSLPRN